MKGINDLVDRANKTSLRDRFLTDGYIFFPQFLLADEIGQVKQQMDAFIENQVCRMPPEQVYYEDKNDKSTLKQLQQLHEYDPFFYNMIFGSRFEKLASILLEDQVVGKNIQYFNKPPKIGQETPPHQDGYYFMLEPNEAVTMWMALEDVDEENGCVRYVPGSHKLGMRSHGNTGTLGFSQGITDFGPDDIQKEVFFPTKAGDLLVHHSLTIHRADGNNSESRSRKAMGFIYYAELAKEDEAAHRAYAAKLALELKNKERI